MSSVALLKKITFPVPLCLFCTFLLYFVFANSWYEPSRLLLRGRSTAADPVIIVQWDSGEGFNGYERREFHPALQSPAFHGDSTIIFGGTDRKNSASLSTEVVCTSIVIDGEEVDLASVAGGGQLVAGELHFNSNETASLTVKARFQISLTFRTNNHSGVAFLSVNGVPEEHDLYMANEAAKYKHFDHWLRLPDGSFTLAMQLPRYAIQELEIVNGKEHGIVELVAAQIESKSTEKQVADLLQGQPRQIGTVKFYHVLDGLRAYFHPGQFCQQIIFALLSTWLLLGVVRCYKRIGNIRACCMAEKRFVFWGLFAVGLGIYGTWLAAFWPGVMSVDSLKVWRAAKLPDIYLNDHPVLNVFLYKYLFQLWSNPAVIPLVQVLLTALLISWFFFWLYRQGGSLRILLPCFLFVVSSVSVGVYTTMLWKDIPFALLVVFWACTLVKMYRERREGRLQWSGQQIIVLVLLALALGLVRHNGLVYLAVLPVLFILFGLVPLKKVLPILLVCALLAGAGFMVLQHSGGVSGTAFIRREIHRYAGDLSPRQVVKNSGRIARDYMGVLNINQTDRKWDKFHYYLRDRYAYWFLLHSGWWDAYPYKKESVRFPALRKIALRIYEKSYDRPWVWFSWNPLWLLGLLPLVTLLFRWFPQTAIFGVVLFAGAIPLIVLRIFNWRYYYFLYLGLLFILPMMHVDRVVKKSGPRRR